MLELKRVSVAIILLVGMLGLSSAWSSPIVGPDGRVPSLAPLLKDVTPAVVNISVRGVSKSENPLYDDPNFREFFDAPEQRREFQSAGSGVIVDASNGYVLTNRHVVENADNIAVTLKDNRRFTAQLIGEDPGTDIAVLRIEADNLVALPMGNSDDLEVGDYIVAIGNPFGLGQTVTSGIVSALGRMGLGIERYENFIQTDASINPGNSGGPLVNLRGEVVGINSAILSQSGGNIGIGFAVPINMAKTVMGQLLAHGQVRRGWLGVRIGDMTPELAQSLSINGVTSGAIVGSVEPRSPAARAGLHEQDVIVAVDDRPIVNAGQLRNLIGFASIGDTIKLTVIRSGESETINVPIEQQLTQDRDR
jgi:Do/DeqQ family serine protease